MNTEPGFLELLLTDTNAKQRLLAYAYLSVGGGGGVEGFLTAYKLQKTQGDQLWVASHLGSITCINMERVAKAFGTLGLNFLPGSQFLVTGYGYTWRKRDDNGPTLSLQLT